MKSADASLKMLVMTALLTMSQQGVLVDSSLVFKGLVACLSHSITPNMVQRDLIMNWYNQQLTSLKLIKCLWMDLMQWICVKPNNTNALTHFSGNNWFYRADPVCWGQAVIVLYCLGKMPAWDIWNVIMHKSDNLSLAWVHVYLVVCYHCLRIALCVSVRGSAPLCQWAAENAGVPLC